MKVNDLFKIVQGNSFELMNMELSNTSNINFVSRTAQDNGVVAQVCADDDINPFPAGVITVALGGSVLSAFVQLKPFYTAFHIAVLTPKKELTLQEKLYYCMCIKANAYRYNFGRQANKTLKYIELPDIIPEWVYTIPVIPIKTKVKPNAQPLNTNRWKEFLFNELFIISVSKDKNLFSSEKGGALAATATPYVSSSSYNNGITGFVDSEPSQKANTMTIARNGSVASTFYQPRNYCASPDDIRILTPKFDMNVYTALFLKTIIEQEKPKYGYGRKFGTTRLKKLVIKLPATSQGLPDWDYMENYIKSLPYADKIM
jgi:hypothetical protein